MDSLPSILLFVVICLKSLTFVVSITTFKRSMYKSISCDLLEKSYLCGINNNYLHRLHTYQLVVICLKSLTFVVSITTFIKGKQRKNSCDLLEKSYLCGINNNGRGEGAEDDVVVICLKSLTFVVSITTQIIEGREFLML